MRDRPGFLLLLAFTACRSGDAASGFSDCHVAAELGAPPQIPADASLVDASPASARTSHTPSPCDSIIASPLPPSTAWIVAQSATGRCGTPPRVAADVCTTAGEMYAGCETRSLYNGECGLERGMQLCNGGLWTVLCDRDSDCPSGFACGDTFFELGVCVRRCSIDTDCGVCGLICDESGLCGSPPPPPQPDGGPPSFPDASL